MSIAKIIVPVTGADRDATALAAAFVAAKPFSAHVVALIVHPDPRFSMAFMGAPLAPQVVQSVVDTAAEMNDIATKAARATLHNTAKSADVKIVDQLVKTDAVTCSFSEMEGWFARDIAQAARLSDLVVFGPVAQADGRDMNECFVEILTKTDKPVLVSANGAGNITRGVAVAWDGGASACHAIVGAMPFLKRAESVSILHIGEPLRAREAGYSTRTSLGELKEYLSLHGVGASVQNFESGEKSTGEALLDAALSINAGLLVMGGYGHSHLRETIFGGVTSHIRWHAELPVLMVH
jgi:nucleotide-binding universal stress UspA family protein